MTGIEPVTSALWVPRSNQLSYIATSSKIGWGTRIRTLEMAESESAALPLGYAPNSYRWWQGYLGSNQGVTGSKPVALPLGYTPNSTLRGVVVRDNGAHYSESKIRVNSFFYKFFKILTFSLLLSSQNGFFMPFKFYKIFCTFRHHDGLEAITFFYP